MEHADVPTVADRLQELQQRAGPLRELETVDQLVDDRRDVAADHVPHVQLRELVVRQVEHRVAARGETLHQRLRLAAAAVERDADEDARLIRRGVAVVELGHAARAERLAKPQELALALRNLDRDQRFAVLAELGPLGDVAKPIEIDVRTARDRNQLLAAMAALDVALQSGHRERAGRLHDDAAVLEDILDRRADLVRLDEDDLVDDLARNRERMIADPADGDTVGKDPDMIQRDRMALTQRVVHPRSLDGLDADHAHFRIELLDVRADAGDEAAAADRHEYRVGGLLPLPGQLDADRALARDHVGVRERMHERELLLRRELHRALVGLVVRVAVQHDFAAERANRIDLDRRRALRHDDHGPDAAPTRGERD